MDGARWSYQAGYDCREMAKLFLNIHERGGNSNLPIPEFFRSHPAALDRYRAILVEYKRLQAETPNDHLHIGKAACTIQPTHLAARALLCESFSPPP